MPSSSWALQKAIHAQLIADAGLTALLGGPRIYDDVPRQPAFPYVTYGGCTVRDWSTGTDDGDEHTVTMHVWCRAAGRKAGARAAGRGRGRARSAGPHAARPSADLAAP